MREGSACCRREHMTDCPNTGKTEPRNSLEEIDGRVISVDAYRGFAIAAMILVNVQAVQGDVYQVFVHQPWHGVSFADLIFPSFLFIVGVSVVLSLSRQLTRGTRKSTIYARAIRRSSILFLLGVCFNLLVSLLMKEGGIRILGVLQRIAIVYLACVLIYVHSRWRTQIIFGIFLLVSYWLAMVLIPVPSVGRGVLEPGRNVAAWVDSLIVPGSMWNGTWDPEGLFSTIPAIVTGVSGVLAGHLIKSRLSMDKKLNLMFFTGFALFVLGGIWNLTFPYNKGIWSSSFVLHTSGLSFLILASFIWLTEVMGYKRWSRFGVVFGMNAIFAYLLQPLLAIVLNVPVHEEISVNSLIMAGMKSVFSPQFASLMFAIGFVAVCYGVVYLLHRKRIYIKI